MEGDDDTCNEPEEIYMPVPDLQIKTRVRAVLTKHWIDLARIDFDCCRGSLRFRGEISLAPEHRCNSPAALIDTLEAEISQIDGVKSVYLVGVTVTADSLASSSESSSSESSSSRESASRVASSGEAAGLELSVSDLEIKARVRAVLAKNRIDIRQLLFDCARGTVTFRGRICFLDGQSVDHGASFLEALQVDLKRIAGVRKVYFMGLKFEKSPEEQEAPPRKIVLNGQGRRRRS